jgi:transaldolase
MQIFIDTANVEFVQKWGELCDGVTTNPTLLAQEIQKRNLSFRYIVSELCECVQGYVSVEVFGSHFKEMLEQGRDFASIHEHVCVKVPMTPDGLRVAEVLTNEEIAVNVTLCFSVSQYLLASRIGVTYVSPFVGRLDDIGESGISFIADLKKIHDLGGNSLTSILASSIRTQEHLKQVALAGADVATISPSLFEASFFHPLTEQGIKKFEKDWERIKPELRDLKHYQ